VRGKVKAIDWKTLLTIWNVEQASRFCRASGAIRFGAGETYPY
jgi:hypothetical protein